MVDAACTRLKLAPAEEGTFRLFREEVTGLGVRLPDWVFPVVCNTTTGEVRYDNFEGRWGHQKHLDHFTQAYAVEKAKIEARRRGHRVSEHQMKNGAIRLLVGVGGAA